MASKSNQLFEAETKCHSRHYTLMNDLFIHFTMKAGVVSTVPLQSKGIPKGF
jgi:hypothetical protein